MNVIVYLLGIRVLEICKDVFMIEYNINLRIRQLSKLILDNLISITIIIELLNRQ